MMLKETILPNTNSFRRKLFNNINQGVKKVSMDFCEIKTAGSMDIDVIIDANRPFEKTAGKRFIHYPPF